MDNSPMGLDRRAKEALIKLGDTQIPSPLRYIHTDPGEEIYVNKAHVVAIRFLRKPGWFFRDAPTLADELDVPGMEIIITDGVSITISQSGHPRLYGIMESYAVML